MKWKSPAKVARVSAKTNGLCAYCGNLHEQMVLDHVIPKSSGGGNADSNLLLACWPCNASKGVNTLEQFRLRRRCLALFEEQRFSIGQMEWLERNGLLDRLDTVPESHVFYFETLPSLGGAE